MKARRQISFILFLFVWVTARCFPPVPLNERTTEKLTYEAYLLIEESLNQQKDSTLERRIKEKSIFIAPIISPESSQECGQDRCKKLMPKKEIPLENLLQLLNQEYGFMEENEEEITTGPLYINIPLKAVEEETDFTMLIAPTKNAAMQTNNNKTPDEDKVDISDIAGIIGVKKGETESLTTLTETTIQESTTETTNANTQDSLSDTTALFFMDPKREVNVKTDATTTFPTTSNTENTDNPIKESTTPNIGYQDSELNLYQMDQALPYVDSSNSFVDVKREVEKAKSDIIVNEKTTESPQTAFTVRSTLVVTKTEPLYPIPLPKVSTPTPFKKPDHQYSTIPSFLFTPINNILTMEDSRTTYATTGTKDSPTSKPPVTFDSNKNFFHNFVSTTNYLSNIESSQSTKDDKDPSKIIFPRISTPSTIKKKIMVRFPTPTPFVRFPTSSTYSSDISDRFGSQSRTTNAPIHRGGTLKTAAEMNLTYAIPIHLNLTSLYERIKAQRENHRNREKHSEWFHLPTKWWDTSQRPPVLRISRKNGHMDVQEVNSDNFFRQLDGRSFGIKSPIQR